MERLTGWPQDQKKYHYVHRVTGITPAFQFVSIAMEGEWEGSPGAAVVVSNQRKPEYILKKHKQAAGRTHWISST